MPMSFYAGKKAPELELSGEVHEELVPLLSTPLLARLVHFYDEDSDYSASEVDELAEEAHEACKQASDPRVRRFLEGLAELARVAGGRASGIRVVRD